MDIKPGWIIASLLVTLFANLLIYGIVQQNIALANSQSQSVMSGGTINSLSSLSGVSGNGTNIISVVYNSFLYNYPSVFNGSWIWARYVLLAFEIPIGWGLALMIIRIGSPVLMGLASFIRTFF